MASHKMANLLIELIEKFGTEPFSTEDAKSVKAYKKGTRKQVCSALDYLKRKGAITSSRDPDHAQKNLWAVSQESLEEHGAEAEPIKRVHAKPVKKQKQTPLSDFSGAATLVFGEEGYILLLVKEIGLSHAMTALEGMVSDEGDLKEIIRRRLRDILATNQSA